MSNNLGTRGPAPELARQFMDTPREPLERLLGRENELRRLRAAIRKRQSKLIWGTADAGKTFLIKKVLSDLPEPERRKCVYWTGTASRRRLVEHLIRELYLAGDPLVRKKVHADGASERTLNRWVNDQSLLRLRGILFSAANQGDYVLFLDHLPSPSLAMAHFLKELIHRTKTPVYLTCLGNSHGEIGFAWRLYWTDEYRIHLGPLTAGPARELLEISIQRFGLGSLDLEGFHENVLRLSQHLPGSIVKMCQIAADPRYHYGDRVKIELVHVDYLMHASRVCHQLAYGHSS